MKRGRIRIVADRHIPFLETVPGDCADIVLADPEDICRNALRDADAMIIRTRTRCDASLLEGTGVKFVASATIGMDHIDIPWCNANGITVCNAQGCNAAAVMQYVFTSLYAVCAAKSISLAGKTLGIIGVGHVGSRVEQAARRLGFKVLLCDPPRAAWEGNGLFVSLEKLLGRSDIVTLHTPLDGTTRAMADKSFFNAMRPGAVFINSSRGETVDEDALAGARDTLGALVIDTWCGEPLINSTLMDMADIATPHIAGYSLSGKINGTVMSVRALGRYFGIPSLESFRIPAAENELAQSLCPDGLTQGELTDRFLDIYDIWADDAALRASVSSFENLRKSYSLRKEIKFETI